MRSDVRWFSAAILVTCVTVAGLGLAMGFYLDRAPEPVPPLASADDDIATAPLPVASIEPGPDNEHATPAIAVVAEPRPALEPDPPSAAEPPPSELTPRAEPAEPGVAAEVPPAPADRPAAQLTTIEPEAGTPDTENTLLTPMVARTAAMAIRPPRLDPAAAYWVEYAVFSRERSAQRLRQALAALHLDSNVVATHTPDGHRLWRVRSATLDSRARAEAGALAARQKLAIVPLIHRGTPGHVAPTRYWVQFGAFPTKAPAIRLQHALANYGVKATIRNTRMSSGKPLFLVRSEGFPDRRLATLVGELGGSAAKVAFVVGRDRPATQQGAPPSTSDRGVGSSSPRHTQRPPPGG